MPCPIRNTVATIWLISFQHILRDNPLAAQYLRFICFLSGKAIPASLLQDEDDGRTGDEAIVTLKGYAFVTEIKEPGCFIALTFTLHFSLQTGVRLPPERESGGMGLLVRHH
jgi:hypothetical protein